MNFNADLSKFFKLPTKVFVALALGTGLILFLPETLIDRIYMRGFRDKFGFILGILFVVSFSISFVNYIIILYKYFIFKYNKHKFFKHSNEKLNNLTSYQKAIIYDLYSQDNYTDELPINDGAVKILENSLMILRTTNTYFVENFNEAVFPYMLQPWVIKKLDNNKELLERFKYEFEKYIRKSIN